MLPGINLIVKQHEVYFTSSRLMPGHAWLWDAYSFHVLSFALPFPLRHFFIAPTCSPCQRRTPHYPLDTCWCTYSGHNRSQGHIP
jgi:hypothetical protein